MIDESMIILGLLILWGALVYNLGKWQIDQKEWREDLEKRKKKMKEDEAMARRSEEKNSG